MTKTATQIYAEVKQEMRESIENNYKCVVQDVEYAIAKEQEKIQLAQEALKKFEELSKEIEKAYSPTMTDTDVLKLRGKVQRSIQFH